MNKTIIAWNNGGFDWGHLVWSQAYSKSKGHVLVAYVVGGVHKYVEYLK